MKKAFINWSSGKDAAFAYQQLRKQGKISVEESLTTITKNLDRVTMHGLRVSVLERQLKALPFNAHVAEIPEDASMQDYENIMASHCERFKSKGLDYAVFGDIFLEDLKAYRDKQLSKMALEGIYPLWKRKSSELALEISKAVKTVVVCVNGEKLDRDFCGQEYDEYFLKQLPKNVDPCGENGEFHTFCYHAEYFKQPVAFEKGALVERSYPNPSEEGKEIKFYFQDLL